MCVRDLGVILDTKLTFADHVDATISKANRMLGLLVRSMQVSSRAHRVRFDHAAALVAYKVHVRSVLEYGSVIWSGAAVAHLRRLERLQHRFSMWLGSSTQTPRPPLDYESLLSMFGCPSMKSRLTHVDLKFARSVLSGRLDCTDIVGMFPLSVPGRRTRRPELFHVQVSRISVVGLTYLAKSSLSVAGSRSMHDKYVRITKLHHSAKWLQHTSTVSGVICQKADFRTFLPWSAHSAWHRL